MENLQNLNIKGNPIEIIQKRLCLLECLLMDSFRPRVDEKLVNKYLAAPYSHVARQRPGTAVLPRRKKVFENCTDEYNYQRDVLTYVSIEEKDLQGTLKMDSRVPRSGGNFRMLRILNAESITVFELEEILYFDKFP